MIKLRNSVLIAMSLLTIWTSGCAHVRKGYEYVRTPVPMTAQQIETLKVKLGNVGVAGAGYVPEVRLAMPGIGAAEGRKKGANSSASVMTQLTSEGLNQCHDLATCLVIAGVGLIVAPAVASVGEVRSSTADDAEEMSMREAKTERVLLDIRLQEQMRDRLSLRLSDLKTFPIRPLQDTGPETVDHKPDYSPMRSNGIDTVSEIAIQSLVFARRTGMNPDLSMTLNVQTRLIEASTNREILSKSYSCTSIEYVFKAWFEQDARIFREEMDRCSIEIAENIVNDLFVTDTLMRRSSL